MRAKVKKKEVGPPGVPAYIVTFSDMVTLLLTFFVMLLSMAQAQDPELFNIARDSFVRHIDTFGLGLLKSKKIAPKFDGKKYKYFVDESDNTVTTRTIDARQQVIIRNFKQVTQSMLAIPSQIVAEKTSYTTADINFEKGQAVLDEQAKSYLKQLALNLRQRTKPEEVKLYVLGLAGDEAETKRQLIVSANRAQAVVNYLKDILPADWGGAIYSWGAGDGGCWVERDSPISENSHILIADLQNQE
ncbi:MAG: OmpA family protein [Anaerohalosphaeraceae bacterium]|nr:OmpA family protein [Anaerohalosphaeraceae bacterium]